MACSNWLEVWDYTSAAPTGTTDLSKIFLYDTFEGEEGQKLEDYDSRYFVAEDSVIDTSDSYSGNSCLQTNLAAGYRGYGSWGYTFSIPPCYEGDEIWIRLLVKMDPSTDTSTGIQNLKFIRFGGQFQNEGDVIDNKWSSGGTFEAGILAGTPVTAVDHRFICEWPVGAPPLVADTNVDYTEWQIVEAYLKLGVIPYNQGGNAISRFWVNGNLVFEDKDRIPTLPHKRDGFDGPILEWPKNGRRSNFLITTYWNGGENDGSGLYPTSDIRWWYDDLAVAVKCAERDDSPYLSLDATSNKYIGTKVGFGSGEIDITQNVTENTIWSNGIYNIRNNITVSADLNIQDAVINFYPDVKITISSSGGNVVAVGSDFLTTTTAFIAGRSSYQDCFFHKVRAQSGIATDKSFVMHDCTVIDAWVTANRTICDLQRNLFFKTKSPGNQTFLVSLYGTIADTSENLVKDNVFVGAMWQLQNAKCTAEGNVFITDENISNQNSWNHESIINIDSNITWKNNLFVGDTLVSFMHIGSNGGANSTVINNTFYEGNNAVQWHLVTVDASGSQYRNNLAIDIDNFLNDEESVADRCVYTDYNAFDGVNNKYRNIFITGKTEGDAGYGQNDMDIDATVELVDVGYGWPHTITEESIRNGTDTYQSIYDGYRNAYSPKPGSVLIGAGDPIDGSPDIGFTGNPT